MRDISQNGIISTLHDFGTKSTSVIENELSKFSKQRKIQSDEELVEPENFTYSNLLDLQIIN